jgi:CRISPR-associated exonuclease Cas4
MPELLIPILLLLSLLLFWLSGRSRKKSALPRGHIIYSDTGLWGKTEKPFFDVETQLTGKPDYLIRQGDMLIPVEVKSHYSPTEPYDSHVMQLMAYCYLLEAANGIPPSHGIIQYRNRSFAVDYGQEQKETLMELLDEIQSSRREKDCSRSHQEAVRCARCGFRDICDQKLI